MRILKIMIKDTKQGFRDKRALMLGLLLPIVMILVLGTALSGAFNSSDALKGIKIA
jgi:ABC-2 type transport system permease protein